jgi:glycosyltransferase involved in cell wall biosynthesis
MSNPANPPLLSIAVPVYNGEKFVAKCLDSIATSLNALSPEDRAAIEVIACDNYSTDTTLEIIRNSKLSCQYRIVQPPTHYENRTSNWHYALSQATGTWMMMLHADDLMAPEGLSAILPACRQQMHGSAVAIAGRIRTFDDHAGPSRVQPYWFLPSLIRGEDLRRHVLPFICPFVPFTIMRRATYLAVNGLNEAYELVQDWDLWIRLLAKGDLYFFPQVFGWWRTHGFSEKYACIFAREHTALALRIRQLVPSLTPTEANRCLEVQLAKARTWVPNFSAATLAAEVPCQEAAIAAAFPTTEDIPKRLQWANRQVSSQLYRLRLFGGLRLLTAT